MMYLRLAWRNLWRNKRRTLITVASVFFAVILSTLMYSLVDGVYVNMVHNVAAFSTGYLQVHGKGYWDEKNIDHVFAEDTVLRKKVEGIEKITAVVPRIETFALASTGTNTTGALLLGIDPAKENQITNLEEKLIKGNYLSMTDNSAMIGSALAERLQLSVGDTLVLLSQGYHAASANGMFPIKGILKLGSPELDRSVVYLPLPASQYLLSLDDQLTAWAIMIGSTYDLASVKKDLKSNLDSARFEVMDWKEMMPELDQMIEVDSGGHKITLGILYLVISFGIFSTILMMLAERKREFGIMVAIGTHKRILAGVVLLETLLITFLGVLAGSLASWPVISYVSDHPFRLSGELKQVYENYGFEPIIPVSKNPTVFLSQAQIVLLIAIVVAAYPVYRVLRLRLMEALRS